MTIGRSGTESGRFPSVVTDKMCKW